MFSLLFKSKNQKYVIFVVETGFLGSIFFFKCFFLILLNEAKTHLNHIDS